MPHLTLEFPLLVHVEADGFCLRPLFQAFPEVTRKRYERAINALRKEIRDEYRQTTLTREDLDDFMWLLFNPDFHYEKVRVTFRSGQRLVDGNFTRIRFELKGYRFTFLPALENRFYCEAKEDRQDAQARFVRVIQDFFREERKNYDDDVDPTAYYTPKGEFCTDFSMGLDMRAGRFSFEQTPPLFFARLFDTEDFDGHAELEKVGYDLNDRYPEQLLKAHYRTEQIKRLQDLLYQKDNVAVALVGPNGCGKTSLLHGAVAAHLTARNTAFIRCPKIWFVDPTRVIAGMSIVGMWQRRFESMLSYIRERLTNAFQIRQTDMLYIDNPVALLRIGKSAQNDMTLCDLIQPDIKERRFSMILEATPEEWLKVQTLNRNFADQFQVMRIAPPDDEQAFKMILLQRAALEQQFECAIENAALLEMMNLYRGQQKTEVLPGGIVRVLNRLAARYQRKTITVTQVHEQFQANFHFRPEIFDHNQVLDPAHVRAFFDQRLIAQTQACQCLTDVVCHIKSRLNDAGRPLASLLFIGPTGVGKTQAAKLLADYLFADSEALVRFDMNEYIDHYAVARLIGDALQPEGQLTSTVRYRKACVVLLDEIEKAHPGIHDLLLQLLDEGRLTDALGQTCDFTQCVIIMTSNLGATEVGKSLGFVTGGQRNDAATYQAAVERFFRPEIINRMDQLVVFQRLSRDVMVNIARLEVAALLQRDGFMRRTTMLDVADALLDDVALRDLDSAMGARGLKRNIEQRLTMPAAEQLAQLPVNQPVILQLQASAQGIRPNVIPMPYAEPHAQQSKLSAYDARNALHSWRALQTPIQTAIAQIDAHRDQQATPDNALLLLRDRIMDLQAQVEDKIWEMDGASIETLQRGESRTSLKMVDSEIRRIRVYLKDLHARMDLHDYLYQQFQAGESLTQTQAAYRQCQLDLYYATRVTHAIAAARRSTTIVHVQTMLSRQGQSQIAYLAKAYRDWWRHLDAFEAEYQTADGSLWQVSHLPGLYEIMQQETGVHLFHRDQSTPIPILVRVLEAPFSGDLNTWLAQQSMQDIRIMRLYSLSDTDPKKDTISDLRTGLMCRSPITPDDWKAFLHQGEE